MSVDCALSTNEYRFRYRSAGIIVEDDEILLVGTDFDGDYTYYSVGGAVHIGELAEDACVREVFEETGIKFEIDRLVVIHESLYDGFYFDTIGKICHEIAFYYLMKPRGTKEIKVTKSVNSSGRVENMHWIKISELDKLPVNPKFLQSYLMHPHKELIHIATDSRMKKSPIPGIN